VALDDERPLEGPLRARRHVGQLRLVLDAIEEDRELVAAEPGHAVVAAHAAEQALGHLDELLVADLVPELVVDRLEPVEVDVEERERAPRLAPAVGGGGELLSEGEAVGQARRRAAQPRLGAQARRSPRRDHDAEPVGRVDGEPNPLPAGAGVTKRAGPRRADRDPAPPPPRAKR
jgi:hypothetical protein